MIALRSVDVAVGVLAKGADQGDDHDHQERGRLPLHLGEADEDGQRRDEEDATADADDATGEATGHADQGCQHLVSVHLSTSSIAIAISSAAKRIETMRWEMRCWTAVPITTPRTAGIASSRPVTTWTLP